MIQAVLHEKPPKVRLSSQKSLHFLRLHPSRRCRRAVWWIQQLVPGVGTTPSNGTNARRPKMKKRKKLFKIQRSQFSNGAWITWSNSLLTTSVKASGYSGSEYWHCIPKPWHPQSLWTKSTERWVNQYVFSWQLAFRRVEYQYITILDSSMRGWEVVCPSSLVFQEPMSWGTILRNGPAPTDGLYPH